MPEPVVAPAPAAPAPAAAAPAPAPASASPPVAAAPAPASNEKGYWPDNWQARLAGDDEKALKQLGRYASPEDIWKKARSLEQRLSSGEFKAVLPKDPKPEELSAWRKDNGIPDAPEKYDLKGLAIPDSDKDIVTSFLKAAHGANFTPEQTKLAVGNYYEMQKQQTEARAAKDDEQRHAALDALNSEWGGSFRR